jgi:cell division protease FtsH
MVTQWGMSDKLGPLQYEEQQGETFLGYSQSQRVHMSNETAKAIDQEIRSIVDAGYDRAKKVLSDFEAQLHLLANALLEYETLSGDEIKTLLDKGEITRDDGTKIKPSPIPVVGSSIPRSGRKGRGGLGGAAAAGA